MFALIITDSTGKKIAAMHATMYFTGRKLEIE